MCGIVGMIGNQGVRAHLLQALGRLEYRGYDSAGAAVAGPGFVVRKVLGGAVALDHELEEAGAAGRAGLAHTRWATHGRADVRNAHPHVAGSVAVVHNGIIENHAALRAELEAAGRVFASSTDSEVVPHLIAVNRKAGMTPVAAVRSAVARLEGAYAIAVLFADAPDLMVAARQGSPLVVGMGGAEMTALASDPAALSGLCDSYAALADGDLAALTAERVMVWDIEGYESDLAWEKIEMDAAAEDGAGFDSHTRREIAEQPAVLARTDAALQGRTLPRLLADAKRLVVVACGSSLYAAGVARPWIEQLGGVPCDLEIASEFRSREKLIAPGTVAVLVSQSGETADTLAVMEQLLARNVPVLGVVNVAHSTLARRAHLLWPTTAGREQGVAATKSFTAQLLALLRLGLAIGVARDEVAPDEVADMERGFAEAPEVTAATLALEPVLANVARFMVAENEALFLGRGWGAAMAAEAALKLKELSYLRADAYPAGELKHGPIALVRDNSPVVLLAPSDRLLAKTVTAAEEVAARGAAVTVLTDAEGARAFMNVPVAVVVLPGTGVAHVFAHAVAVQLIAYHAARVLGRNVDRPRNLAKSVTVE